MFVRGMEDEYDASTIIMALMALQVFYASRAISIAFRVRIY